MVPLAYYDQHFLPLDYSYQLSTANSLAHQYTGGKLSQPNNQSVVRVHSHNKHFAIPPLNSNKKVHSCSILSPVKSQDINSEGFHNTVLKPPSYHSKYQATPSLDLHQETSMQPNWSALSSPLSCPKFQRALSLDLKTSSSLESNQTSLNLQLPFSKSQNRSALNLCWTSPSLKSSQRVSSTTLSTLKYQETPYLNIPWTSSSLGPNQSTFNASLPQPKPHKMSSLNSLWTLFSEHNQRSLSSPSLNSVSQTKHLLQKSPLWKPNQMSPRLPLFDPRLETTPVLSTNSCVLGLPLSHSKPLQSPSPCSVHQTQSLPLFQSKSQPVLTLNHDFRTMRSPVCAFKFQNTASPSDKHRVLLSSHPKPTILVPSLSSSKFCIRSLATSTFGSRLLNKSNFNLCTKADSDKDIPWTLDYTYPCIVKGGTLPVDVINKIVNSVSKTRIQRDLSRQILFRRMRGRPNPHPGPRLSSSYMVCLTCASCIKSQCTHLTGRKDPRGATLFVIPTPELSTEGKTRVKLVLILSLPETSSLACHPLPVTENQPDDTPEDNFERVEKISQLFPASEPDITKEDIMKNKWLTVDPENKVVSQQPQAVDWLLYVKKSNSQSQWQSQLPSSSLSTSSSSSSASSSSSSSSSSSKAPSLTPPSNMPTKSTLSGCVFTKEVNYHRLPPGVSWLEFICNKNHQPLPGKSYISQSPPSKAMSMRKSSTTIKGTKGSKLRFKFFQTKFQNEENLN